jgi:hypothetical protein
MHIGPYLVRPLVSPLMQLHASVTFCGTKRTALFALGVKIMALRLTPFPYVLTFRRNMLPSSSGNMLGLLTLLLSVSKHRECSSDMKIVKAASYNTLVAIYQNVRWYIQKEYAFIRTKQNISEPNLDVMPFYKIDVVTAMVMKSSASRNITSCRPVKVNRRFGGIYRFQILHWE